MEINNAYPNGSKVEVYDVGRKRWYKATILCVLALDDNNQVCAWEAEIDRNGNRGGWQAQYVRERR